MAFFGGNNLFPFGWPMLPMLSRQSITGEILQLKREGTYHWQNQNSPCWYYDAIGSFDHAIELCERHSIHELKADIHWHIAAVKIDLAKKEVEGQSKEQKLIQKLFNEVDRHLKECIRLDKSSYEGYFYRAISKRLRAVWLGCKPHPSILEDFVKAYRCQLPSRTDEPVQALCQALFTAMNHGLVSSLKLDFLDAKACTNLLKAVLKHDEAKLEHIEYLIHEKADVEGSGLACRLSVKLRGCSLRDDLPVKWFSEPYIPLIKALVRMGMVVTKDDIKIVIKSCVKDLNFLTSLVTIVDPDLTDSDVCELCLSCQNMPFASHFLSLGAQPKPDIVIENLVIPCQRSMKKEVYDCLLSYLGSAPECHEKVASKAISGDCFVTFQRFSQSLNEEASTALCEQALKHKKKNFVDHLMQKCGANPALRLLIDALHWYECDCESAMLEYLVQNPTSHQEIGSHAVTNNNHQFFQKFGSLLDQKVSTSLCEQALLKNKKEIVKHLIQKCGAKPDSEAVLNSFNWHNPDEVIIEYLVSNPATHRRVALQATKKDNFDILCQFASLLDQESCLNLCREALTLDKIKIANHLIQNCGAHPEPDEVMDALVWYEYETYYDSDDAYYYDSDDGYVANFNERIVTSIDPDKELLEYLFHCPSCHEKVASQAMKNDNFQVFQRFVSTLDNKVSTSLCEQALRERKTSMAVHLIKDCEASPDPTTVVNALHLRSRNPDESETTLLDYLILSPPNIHKKIASEAIRKGNFQVFQRFVSTLDNKVCTSLCEQALRERKTSMAVHLIKDCEASPDPTTVVNALHLSSRNPDDSETTLLDYLILSPPNIHKEIASEAIRKGNFQVFQRFVSTLDNKVCTSLCEQALHERKTSMAVHLIKKYGASPDPETIVNALHWYKSIPDDSETALLDYLVQSPTSIHKDIASRALQCNNLPVFQRFAYLLCKDASAIAQICNDALFKKKMDFVVYLVEQCNAKPEPKKILKLSHVNMLDKGLLNYLERESGPKVALRITEQAIRCNRYDIASTFADKLAPGEANMTPIDLCGLLQSTNLATNTAILEKLLVLGVDPNGIGKKSGLRPLDVALTLSNPLKGIVAALLLKYGACTVDIPIIHLFTELAFETGNLETLEMVCKQYRFPEDGKLVDRYGRTPFHLAMKYKQGKFCEKVVALLCEYCIDPDIRDNCKDKAYYVAQHGKGKGDKRVKLLQEHSKKFSQKRKKTRKSKAKSKNANNPQNAPEVNKNSTYVTSREDEERPNLEPFADKHDISELSESDQLKHLLDRLHSKDDSYFKGAQQSYQRQLSRHKSIPTGASVSTHLEPQSQESDSAPAANNETETDTSLDVRFEGLPWEVECPETVVKFLKSERHPAWLRKMAIQKIGKLAEGNLSKKSSGKVVCHKEGLCLREIRLTDAARILWERAVQFSPRLTEKGTAKAAKSAVHVYSEVIRVWDIVLDHDNLNRSITYVKKSHERGCKAAVKYPLNNPARHEHPEQRGLEFPEVYLVGKDIDKQEAKRIAERIFVPAGSTKEDEYNVITFYSFTSSFVKSLLEGEHARRDFPYKEWPKEHEIINMPQHEESILLLGRSGTGKTTCCLYRLWNHFQTYWLMAENSGPTVPRAALTLLANQSSEACADLPESELDSSFGSSTELEASQNVCTNTAAQPCEDPCVDMEMEADEEPHPKEILEHLHQVFITKNYVLCAQMKKRFYDLAAGNDIAKDHMQYEDVEEAPINISDLQDQAYPIFLTARQFFLMLDNSLEDGKQFFPRDAEGKLKEKVVSSDYDHENPDTLLDLEESDSEEENDDYGDFEDEGKTHRSAKKQQVAERKEVTAFYFAEKIWPEIKHDSCEKKLDPLLVWMEIKSFIKGSKDALQCKEGFLSEESYKKLIGEKRASNFVGKREELYKLFKAYNRFLKHTATENLFDDCDFVHNIHTRLDMLQDLPWSIHSIYIDEVQDFTQAELALLLRCCRHPNGLFLTGDTAQSIMRGIAFRFGDLRTLFHDANERAKAVKGAVPVKVPKVHELTINFRSHSGILELASSIIDLLKKFFPESFDSLPGDEGMFPGPVPVLLESSSISDLAILLRGNKRQSSSIEFGAHQVIIVQSEEAKQSLPDALKAGNVLTVFESKGLEFDDVILYDFFKNSKVTKDWRVITTFIESNAGLRKKDKSDFSSEPRKLEFDELQHKSLNAELKYLYTAITRAKCNLWIYDSDSVNRLPMFDYWVKRGLVKVVKVDLTKDDQNVLFAVQSSKDEWKNQGDYFKKKGLWEPAMKCYWKAGNVQLEMETKAYFLAKQAKLLSQKPKDMQLHFLRAAIAFLECDKSSHDVSCLEKAAKCLKNSKKHSEAARLYARLNQHDKALAQFRRSNDIDGYVHFKEINGQHSEAVQLYVKKNRRLEALKLAAKYEQQGITLLQGLAPKELAVRFAKFYSEKGYKEKLLNVVEYIPDVQLQVDILKRAGMFKEACDFLVGAKQFHEAYQLYRVQGKYTAAIKLAEKQKDPETAEKFTLYYAISVLANDKGTLDEVRERLQQISTSSSNHQHKALSYLLLGRTDSNAAVCRQSSYQFIRLKVPQIVGQMEACVAQLEYENVNTLNRSDDVWKVLHACGLVNTVSGCLKCEESRRSPTQSNTVRQMEALYGLEKRQDSYACFEKEIRFWMGKDFKPRQYTDADGRILIRTEDVMALVIKRLEKVIDRWIVKDELEIVAHLKSKVKSFPFNDSLSKTGHLPRSFLSYPHNELSNYLKVCNDAANVSGLVPKNPAFPIALIIRVILNLFSPQAAMYMPISKAHLRHICIICNELKNLLKTKALEIQTAPDADFNMDRWFDVWRVHCIFGTVPDLHRHFTERPRTDSKPYFDYRDQTYDHYMSLWLRSCTLIAKESKVITSFKIVVHYIVKRFAQKSAIQSTLSTANLLHILCIHSTALLAISKICSDRLQKKSRVYVPSLYDHVVRVFDVMNIYSQERKGLLRACFEDDTVLKTSRRPPVFLHNLLNDIYQYLWEVLGILTGSTYPPFKPLHSVMTKESIENGDARHCLMLALTLFANLALTDCSSGIVQQYRVQIMHAITQPLVQQTGTGSELLKKAYNLFAGHNSIAGTFMALSQLISSAGEGNYIAEMTIKKMERQHTQSFVFNHVKLQHYPQQPVTPLPMIEISKASDEPQVKAKAATPKNAWGIQRSLSQPVNPQPTPDSVQTASVVEASPAAEAYSSPPEPATVSEALEEVENDEDVQEALKQSKKILSLPAATITPTPEAGIPSEQDQSLIDENFCKICAVPLQTKKQAADDDLPHDSHEELTAPVGIERSISGDSKEFETPADHCKSRKHIEQWKLRQRFLQLAEESYEPLKEKLVDMKLGLELYGAQFAVEKILVQIGNDIGNNERYIDDIKLSADWREGCFKIENEMIGRIESLLQKCEMELEKAKKTKALEESHSQALPDSEEEEEARGEAERLEEVEDPSSSAAQQKGRSRARKKHKKKRK